MTKELIYTLGNTQVSTCEEEFVTLLYFGLIFMWLDTKISKGVIILPFRKVKELCPQFADNIAEDIRHLNWEEVYCRNTVHLGKCLSHKVAFLLLNMLHIWHVVACSSVTYTASMCTFFERVGRKMF